MPYVLHALAKHHTFYHTPATQCRHTPTQEPEKVINVEHMWLLIKLRFFPFVWLVYVFRESVDVSVFVGFD